MEGPQVKIRLATLAFEHDDGEVGERLALGDVAQRHVEEEAEPVPGRQLGHRAQPARAARVGVHPTFDQALGAVLEQPHLALRLGRPAALGTLRKESHLEVQEVVSAPPYLQVFPLSQDSGVRPVLPLPLDLTVDFGELKEEHFSWWEAVLRGGRLVRPSSGEEQDDEHALDDGEDDGPHQENVDQGILIWLWHPGSRWSSEKRGIMQSRQSVRVFSAACVWVCACVCFLSRAKR